MYYFHGNCRKCTEKIVGDLVREGKTRFIIYGFGDAGMKVKSILNVCMGIQEHLVVDDSLAGRYRNIKSFAGLTAEDLKDAVVLVASDEDTVYNDMGEPEDAYSRFRADLYRHVPKEQCVELFPRPRRVLEAFRIGDMRADLESALRLAATEQTAEFIMENLIDTPRYADRYELLEHILCDELSADPGLMLEFGVFRGNSIDFIAGYAPTHAVYGFDSFEGIPERWTSDPEGMYSTGGVLPDVKPNVRLIRGWFEETLPRFLKEHGEKCSFIHIDCDLYSSARTVLSELRERIVPGTVIVFDEYFNYPGWQQHEYRAFQEFTEESGTAYEYIGYCRNGQHAAVRITEVRK